MRTIEIDTTKDIRSQLASDKVEFVLIKNINAKVAQCLLNHQVDYNRDLDIRKVREYSRDMTDGNWYMDAPGSIMCFDKNGAGISLQHRLQAVINADYVLDTYAQLGCSNPEYGDLGKTRSMNDRLMMNGVSADFNNKIAVLVRNIFHVIDDKNPSTTGVKSEYTYQAYEEFVKENRDRLKELYNWSAKIYDIPNKKNILYSWGGSRLQRSIVEAYMYYLHFYAGWDWETVFNFFKGITSNIPNENPVIEKCRVLFATNATSAKAAKFSTQYIDYCVRIYFNTYASGNVKVLKAMSFAQYQVKSVGNGVIPEKFWPNTSHNLKVM